MTATPRSEAQTQQDVIDELGWDTRVSPAEVGVQVTGSTVTLTGVIDTWAKRKAAEEAAHRVTGVLDVANDLEVRLSGAAERTDTDVAHAVRWALESDLMVPDKNIHSTVSMGVVTLKGDVGLWSERLDAERAIERLAGVTAVVNKIRVMPAALTSTELRAALQKALERTADRKVSRIALRATDGVLHVDGAAHVWAEKNAV